MFKKEYKFNFKSFIIWTLITLSIFLLVYLMYPSIMSSENAKMIDELVKIFPKEVLVAFNMDIASMDSAFGWLKSEGSVFILLIISCYAGILGSSILLKEENDKTIEYLHSLPIKRTTIVLNKVLVGVINITALTLILGLFNYIGLSLSGDFNQKQFILLSITPLFPALVTFFICLFISTFTHKTKKTLGVSLGIVLVSYMLNTFSAMAKEVEFLKYASVFTLADIRNVIMNNSINEVTILITILLSVLFLSLTIIHYNKKELI